VVSTSIGVEGIDAVADQHLLVADDADRFAAAVCTLLEDVATASAICDAARRYVEQRHSWDAVAAEVDDVWRRVALVGVFAG
jgi:glycosyltransferase involved in cell wall biosynthesis